MLIDRVFFSDLKCVNILLDKISSVKIFYLVLHKMYIDMDSVFCNNLKSIRKSSGYTQKEVAEKLGVVESCYANWEQGRTEPNIDTLRKLCVIFDVDISDLIF